MNTPSVTTTLRLRATRCASGVARLEESLRAVPGVRQAAVDLAAEHAVIEHDPGAACLPQLIQAIEMSGYEVPTSDAAASESGTEEHQSHHHNEQTSEVSLWRWRLFIGGMFAAAVVVLPLINAGSALLQMALAAPVQLVLGWPFYRDAWRGLQRGRAEVDLLVAVGASIPFIYSVFIVLAGGQAVHFDIAAFVLVIIGVGKLIELQGRNSASANQSLTNLQPQQTTVIRNGAELTVPTSEVVNGDVVVVRPAQNVPADGRIIEGLSTIDTATLTGDSIAAEVGPGDRVFAGAVNQTGSFRFEVTATGRATLLAQILGFVKQAQQLKISSTDFAERTAATLVPVVLVLAVAALLGWGLGTGDWPFAVLTCASVLIIASPWALRLSTPVSLMAGAGVAARHGLLIKNGLALERAGGLTDVVLDKTGSLTQGRPAVTDVISLDSIWDRDAILRLAAAVEVRSDHPLGQAIVELAAEQDLDLPDVEALEITSAGGLLGRVKTHRIVVGRLPTIRRSGVCIDGELERRHAQLERAAKSVVVVAVDGRPAGLIATADQPRPDADTTIAALQHLGLRTVMLTGDNGTTAQTLARQLGINEVLAEVLPTQKQQRIHELQQQGRSMAVVGDGVADAAALTSADIGIALGGGANASTAAGHLVLVGNDLANLPRAIGLSRAIMRRIRLGLFCALLYNLVLIPLAAAGLLSPITAAAATALAPLLILCNAMTLRWTWRP